MSPEQPTTFDTPRPKHKVHLSLDLRLVVIILLIVIGVMLGLWRPWQTKNTTDRTIQVTGNATVKAQPDEFTFNPSYDFQDTDKTKALSNLTTKSNQLVADLKKLGVADSAIKTNASDYGYLPVYNDGQTSYTLNLTITIDDKSLAQKVQDYLITTSPSGDITPQPDFSQTKQKQLEAQARTAAEQDAKAKADQSAKNIGFKVTSVKSVSEGGFDNGIEPLMNGANLKSGASTQSLDQLTIQPGENDLSYSVSVTYFIK